MKLNLIIVKNYLLKKIVFNNWSSLPYSVFKTNLNSYLNIKLNISTRRLKWRNSIVALRAPKHFKIGKQHYNLSKRISIISLTNKTITNKTECKIKKISSLIKYIKTTTILEQHQPLTKTKSISTTLTIRLQLKKLK